MADVFVFGSKSETQRMAILEAMAAGLPVVAVRSSGTDDVIQEGKTGFKTFDRTEAWGERLLYLIENNEARAKLFRTSSALCQPARHRGLHKSISQRAAVAIVLRSCLKLSAVCASASSQLRA